MKFDDNINIKEYEEFVNKQENSHFMQTYEFGEIGKNKQYLPHYVGLRKDDKLVCTALILEKKLIGKYSFYYIPRGFTIDYYNKDLLKTFTNYLYKYCKKKHVIFLIIDPAIKRHTLNLEGDVIEGEDNNDLIKFLKEIGYHHHGFNLGFEGYEPRFTFRINIDKPMDEIYKSFHATTRKVLNKGNQYQLKVYKGDINDINDFYKTMIETAKREGILQAPIKYYKEFYKIFHQKNMSDLYIVKGNIKKLQSIFENDIQLLKNKQEDNPVKQKEKEERLIKLQKILDEINSIEEEEITLASIITVKYKDMVWTVHGGNDSRLMSLNANYLLYYTIIQDAHDEGRKVIDLFGTCGVANPSKDNPIYGIHNFKKRLGGEYTEFIGEFDLIINKPMYFLYHKVTSLRNKLRKIFQKEKRN